MSIVSRLKGHRSSLIVTGLASAFGVGMLSVTSTLDQIVRATHPGVASATDILSILAIIFLALAIYVGAIVTANTFATIVTGRSSTIALMRLLGSTAQTQRRELLREGATVGIVGALGGGGVGLLLGIVFLRLLVLRSLAPSVSYQYASLSMLLPVLGVVASTVLASWVGSRGVLRVSPVQATGAAQAASTEEVNSRTDRNRLGLVLFVGGDVLLLLGAFVGLVTPLGILISFLGGILSFSGVVAGGAVILPAALRVVGRLFGSSPSARMASANTDAYPDRSARSTIGLVIGVTLVTTLTVALLTFQGRLDSQGHGDDSLGMLVGIFGGLIGFSAVIAAVGLVNNLTLSILQRRRELGLLRALGFTVRQIRAMVLAEAAQMVVTSMVVGLLLGIFYGWVAAQSLLGYTDGHFFPPVVPGRLIWILAVAATVLTLVASVGPTRSATRTAPVEALRVD